MSKHDLTAERLRELLNYDPETGVFNWAVARGKRIKAGTVAGAVSPLGYQVIGIDGKLRKAHRMAWLHVYGGEIPERLDHINRIKTDNRIANLRPVTSVRNHLNITAARKDNVLGVRGVSPYGNGRFLAQIMYAIGKNKRLGVFDTIEEAKAAYLAAKQERDPEALLVPPIA